MVADGVAATMLTRFVPFVAFRPGKPTPKYIVSLGKVLPASVFALLVSIASVPSIPWRGVMLHR